MGSGKLIQSDNQTREDSSDKGNDNSNFNDGFSGNQYTVEDLKNMSIAPGPEAMTESQGIIVSIEGANDATRFSSGLSDAFSGAKESGLEQGLSHYQIPLDRKVYENNQQEEIIDAIVQAKINDPDAKVVLVGHSMGGEAIEQIANELQKEGINVDFATRLDSTDADEIFDRVSGTDIEDTVTLDNVHQSIDIRPAKWPWGGERVEGAVANIEVPMNYGPIYGPIKNHTEIDDLPNVHNAINDFMKENLSGHLDQERAEEIASSYGYSVVPSDTSEVTNPNRNDLVDTNMSNDAGEAVHVDAPESFDDDVYTPVDANMSNDAGEAVHVDAPDSFDDGFSSDSLDDTYTPVDANMSNEAGEAVQVDTPDSFDDGFSSDSLDDGSLSDGFDDGFSSDSLDDGASSDFNESNLSDDSFGVGLSSDSFDDGVSSSSISSDSSSFGSDSSFNSDSSSSSSSLDSGSSSSSLDSSSSSSSDSI